MPLRSLLGRPVGLALGGGAARGIAHIGALRALEERRIKVSFIAGTSAGAVAACLWAGGMRAEGMERWIRSSVWRAAVRPRISRRGVATIGPLADLLTDAIGTTTFEGLKIPLTIMATSLLTGEPVALSEGALEPALQASCSIPGIFTPVRLGDDLLVDGGLVANVPAGAVRAMGARRVIAVDLGVPYEPSGQEPSDVFEIIITSLGIVQRWGEGQRLADADLVIAPDLTGLGLARADRIDDRIDAGYRAAVRALDLAWS